MVFRASHANRATPWCISSRQNHLTSCKIRKECQGQCSGMLWHNVAGECSILLQYQCLPLYMSSQLPNNVTCLHLPWPTYSPELMKDAIMPLNLTRASCSSSALVVSDSLGSADLGIPMETASCRSWPVT